jgi:hypothetical protein
VVKAGPMIERPVQVTDAAGLPTESEAVAVALAGIVVRAVVVAQVIGPVKVVEDAVGTLAYTQVASRRARALTGKETPSCANSLRVTYNQYTTYTKGPEEPPELQIQDHAILCRARYTTS